MIYKIYQIMSIRCSQLPNDTQGDTATATVVPRVPDKNYPQSLCFLNGSLIRLSANPAKGFSYRPFDNQLVPNTVSPTNILDRWRRQDLKPNSSTPGIDIPLNATYLPIRREYQHCPNEPNDNPHK